MTEIYQPNMERDTAPAIAVLRYIAEELPFPKNPTPEEFRGFLNEYGITQVLATVLEEFGSSPERVIWTDEFSASLFGEMGVRISPADAPRYLLLHNSGADESATHYGIGFHLNGDFTLNEKHRIVCGSAPEDWPLILKACAGQMADILDEENLPPAIPYAVRVETEIEELAA